MEIIESLLTLGASHGRTGQKMTPQGIVVHYVGNPGSTAKNNRNYFENGSSGLGVSSHYIIGLEGEIIRCIPDNECAQHAGKSYGTQWDEMAKTNNSRFIGIENCHPDASGKFSAVTTASLVELVKNLCAKHGLDSQKHVYRHYDVCGKICPLYYVSNPQAWEELRAKFAAVTTFEANCDKLEKAGVMNPGSYWKARKKIDPYFEGLVANMAKKV